MAALLECVLSRKVNINKVVGWLRNVEESDSDSDFTVHKQEFVPFLLNFLREQSSQALTHGPATPAKTPSHPRPAARSRGGFSDQMTCRHAGSSSRVQLFSPALSPSPGNQLDAAARSGSSSPSFSTAGSPASRPSGSERRHSHKVCLGDYMASPPDVQHSPVFQSHKGRKKSGGSSAVGGQIRHGGGRGDSSSEETGRWDSGGKRSGRGGGYNRISEQVSPPSLGQLNFNNMEEFPPVGSSPVSPATSKPSRRINPTPVSGDRPHSKPKTCFTSTPFLKTSSPASGAETPDGLRTAGSPMSLKEERELLKQEKTKRAQHVTSPSPSALDPCTPTKPGARTGSKVAADVQTTSPELSKVTLLSELELLVEVYSTCISENLVPNVFLELFFVMQLLTSRSSHAHCDEEEGGCCGVSSDVLDRCYLRQTHNCVFFAVKVLENQFQLVAHLDKCTLRLLAENERVASFSPDLRARLTQAQDTSTVKLSPSVSTFVHSVPFQPATDNRSNFGSDKAFHIFKKQRDIFYELLREWEDFHKEPGWNFDAVLGGRVRGMVKQLTLAGIHSHFARLFLKQLVQMCKGPRVISSSVDTADADLLGMLGADCLGRLKRLEERLVQPQGVVGPCPPPSFPGHQEFFKDFIQTASCCQLSQHLQDRLCQQLLQLEEVSILSPPASIGDAGEEEEEEDGDMEQQDEKQRFSSVLLLARLLAKFLGFISFFPYQTSERPSREMHEASLALRSKRVQVLDVCAVLRNSMRRKRTILTVPWLVEFLSMLDFVGPLLLCYRNALDALLLLYRSLQLNRCDEMCYLNKLLLVSVLGWMFQIPVIPEEIFFSSDFSVVVKEEDSASSAGLDFIPLVDQQLLYTCCPFLDEFRKLLAAFVSGNSARSGGILRKITPTSAELKGTPAATRLQQKLQMDLEQAFFHNQPPSLRRTVEFVAERVGSNAVKHMKATLVQELVDQGEKMLRDGLESPHSNSSKLNDSICAQLCDAGLEAVAKASRYCNEKSPEAIRVLLADETTSMVLITSENIAKRLAADKACSWLSANITALVRREWKSRYDRVMKVSASPGASDSVDGVVAELVNPEASTTPKKNPGHERVLECPPLCQHRCSRPSDILVEIKELLSIAVGPRTDEELPTAPQINSLLQRAGDTLACKKFSMVTSEQMFLSCSVLLACKLVSGELPVRSLCCGEHSEVVVHPSSGSEPAVSEVLEQLVELWGRSCCLSVPLHQLFSPLTITAVLKANNTEKTNYLFLVRRLVDKCLLSEDDVLSHWKKLSHLALPALIQDFQLRSNSRRVHSPPAEVQTCSDTL